MLGGSDPRWDDPRERDDESRDVEVHWIPCSSSPEETAIGRTRNGSAICSGEPRRCTAKTT